MEWAIDITEMLWTKNSTEIRWPMLLEILQLCIEMTLSNTISELYDTIYCHSTLLRGPNKGQIL